MILPGFKIRLKERREASYGDEEILFPEAYFAD